MFEAILMAGFGLQIAEADDYTDPRITYLLHELGEETRHSRLFARLLDQLGPAAPNPIDNWFTDQIASRVVNQIIHNPALLYTMVLAGEEIPDLLQKRAADHPGTDPFVREVNRYHRQEEARHLSFARTRLPEVWETAGIVDKTLVRFAAPLFIREMYENMIHAGVFGSVGLPAMATWQKARNHPGRVQTRVDATRPVLEVLVAAGALERGKIPRRGGACAPSTPTAARSDVAPTPSGRRAAQRMRSWVPDAELSPHPRADGTHCLAHRIGRRGAGRPPRRPTSVHPPPGTRGIGFQPREDEAWVPYMELIASPWPDGTHCLAAGRCRADISDSARSTISVSSVGRDAQVVELAQAGLHGPAGGGPVAAGQVGGDAQPVGPLRPRLDLDRPAGQPQRLVGVAAGQGQLAGPHGGRHEPGRQAVAVGQGPLLVSRVGEVGAPVEPQRPAVQVESGRRLALVLGLGGPVDEGVERVGVHVQPAVGDEPQRRALGPHEERRRPVGPVGLEHGEQVGQRDPQVAQRAGGVEVGPQGPGQLLAGAAAPGEQQQQQGPDALAAPVGVVDRTVVAPQRRSGPSTDRSRRAAGSGGRASASVRAQVRTERGASPSSASRRSVGRATRAAVDDPGLGVGAAPCGGRGRQLDDPRRGEEGRGGRPRRRASARRPAPRRPIRGG